MKLNLLIFVSILVLNLFEFSFSKSNCYLHQGPIKPQQENYIFDNLLSLRGGKYKPKKSIVQNILTKLQDIIINLRKHFWKGSRKTNMQHKKLSQNLKINPKKAKDINNVSKSTQGMVRLAREIESLIQSPPTNCKLIVDKKNIRSWIVEITGIKGTVFADEKFKLKLEFGKDYPSKPPSVYFLKPVPRHVHVYSNGDICLNLLGRDWRPNMTAESLIISILSMLSSAKEKGIPQGNALHSDSTPGKQQDNWMYHDDKC